jgi:hypothetical protein
MPAGWAQHGELARQPCFARHTNFVRARRATDTGALGLLLIARRGSSRAIAGPYEVHGAIPFDMKTASPPPLSVCGARGSGRALERACSRSAYSPPRCRWQVRAIRWLLQPRSGEIKLVAILVLVRKHVVVYLRITIDNCINTIVLMCMHIKPSVLIMELLVEATTRMRGGRRR